MAKQKLGISADEAKEKGEMLKGAIDKLAEQYIERPEEVQILESHDPEIVSILLEIIDACYRSDPDVHKWKPIREKVEGLLNVRSAQPSRARYR